MGVLACYRSGCNQIMCDRLLLGHYLCNECFAELEEWRKTWPDTTQVHDVHSLIKEFMESDKGSMLPRKDTTPEEVEEEFRRIIRVEF